MLLSNSSTTSNSSLGVAYLLPSARHLLQQDGREHATQAGPDLCGLLLVAAGAHAPHHDGWHVASQRTTLQPVHHLPQLRQTHTSRREPLSTLLALGWRMQDCSRLDACAAAHTSCLMSAGQKAGPTLRKSCVCSCSSSLHACRAACCCCRLWCAHALAQRCHRSNASCRAATTLARRLLLYLHVG